MKRGFTLIELLAVITILSVLAAIILVNINSARARARDAARFADLENFQRGLELYFQLYGVYPCGNLSDTTPNTGTYDRSTLCLGSWRFLNGSANFTTRCPATQTTYPPQITPKGLFDAGIVGSDCPKDPTNVWTATYPHYSYSYHTNDQRTSYILGTYLETDPAKMQSDGGLCRDTYEVGPGVGLIQPLTLEGGDSTCTP